SSCQDTVARCEAAEECRWHLGELRVRCAPNTCRRTDCAAALQRFARFVPFALVESMMFCHCSAGDSLCAQQQELLYPKCLYSTSSSAITCTEAARKCDTDHRCRHLRHSLSANCPVAYEACAKTSLDECRRTILHARASILEQPCYCPLSDVECMAHQRTMIPNNPCIEKAMLDYSRLMGYNTPTGAKTDRRLNQAGAPVGHRGVTRPGTSGKDIVQDPGRRKKPERATGLAGQATARSRCISHVRRYVDWSGRCSSWCECVSEDELVCERLPCLEDGKCEAPLASVEGCYAKDASGRQIFVHTGSIMRRYVDWSGRCSSWCECVSEDELVCERLPCLEDGKCEAPLASVDFGERLFLRDRGACFCESGTFICDLPEEMPEVYPEHQSSQIRIRK
ncbi:GDNF/GAS1 domain protein, partial [Teladorsagia circumcincta]